MLKHQNLPTISSGCIISIPPPGPRPHPYPGPESLSDLITFRMNLVLNMKAEEAKLEE